ncbi:MAG: PEP-CTERM sorting domain-containing protein [Sedimentisphaerales bacterium]|nr:PEP-CTERM sorting domain-containing protein [Sedimentisphaerales bacterium]
MDVEYYNDNISKKARLITQHLIRYFGIGIFALTISLCLTAKADAIYLLPDFSHAGTYIDKQWYYFLDHGQYSYLDKGQYHLIGKLGHYLGHPFYPGLHERTIGFTGTINKGWFLFLSEKFSINEYIPPAGYFFDTWATAYRQHYYFADIGKYNYLDKGQYQLLGTPVYYPGCLHLQGQLVGTIQPSKVNNTPEPSTIVFLGLGAIGIILRRKNIKA